jgi:hypothetical protein
MLIFKIKFKVEKYCNYYEFRCNRGACIDESRVCDLVDDCGDGSDESGKMHNQCENYSQCDFENGICYWEHELDADTFWVVEEAKVSNVNAFRKSILSLKYYFLRITITDQPEVEFEFV